MALRCLWVGWQLARYFCWNWKVHVHCGVLNTEFFSSGVSLSCRCNCKCSDLKQISFVCCSAAVNQRNIARTGNKLFDKLNTDEPGKAMTKRPPTLSGKPSVSKISKEMIYLCSQYQARKLLVVLFEFSRMELSLCVLGWQKSGLNQFEWSAALLKTTIWDMLFRCLHLCE